MSWLTALPVVGGLVEKFIDRFWPDKSKQREKTLEIELEQARQSGGRITPRMAFQYVLVAGFAVFIALSVAVFFFPHLGSLHDVFKALLPLATAAFGF